MHDTKGAAAAASETVEKATNIARDELNKVSEAAHDYASGGLEYANEVTDSLADFAVRQPWLALAGAFALGYLAAQAFRRLA